ncbi:MAG: DNA mismatch endonuclease Vsr [Nitratireductor sp.]
MADIVDPETRSRMMSGIRERIQDPNWHSGGHCMRAVFDIGCMTKLPGKPDLILPKFRAAIFVHGCFWHRHDGCKYATMPASRPEFWQGKFRENVGRDQRNIDGLLELGWRVVVVWECEIRSDLPGVADRLEKWVMADATENQHEAKGGDYSSLTRSQPLTTSPQASNAFLFSEV